MALRASYEFAENIQAYIRGEGNYRPFSIMERAPHNPPALQQVIASIQGFMPT